MKIQFQIDDEGGGESEGDGDNKRQTRRTATRFSICSLSVCSESESQCHRYYYDTYVHLWNAWIHDGMAFHVIWASEWDTKWQKWRQNIEHGIHKKMQLNHNLQCYHTQASSIAKFSVFPFVTLFFFLSIALNVHSVYKQSDMRGAHKTSCTYTETENFPFPSARYPHTVLCCAHNIAFVVFRVAFISFSIWIWRWRMETCFCAYSYVLRIHTGRKSVCTVVASIRTYHV